MVAACSRGLDPDRRECATCDVAMPATSHGNANVDEGDLSFADTLTSGVTTPSGASALRGRRTGHRRCDLELLLRRAEHLRTYHWQPADPAGVRRAVRLARHGPGPGLALSPNIRGAGWTDIDTGDRRACAPTEASTVTLPPGAAAETNISATTSLPVVRSWDSEPPTHRAGIGHCRWTSWNAANPLIGVPRMRTIDLGPVGVTGDQSPIPADKGPEIQLTKDSTQSTTSRRGRHRRIDEAATNSTFDTTTGQRTSSAKVMRSH